jgi:hypothetical protein
VEIGKDWGGRGGGMNDRVNNEHAKLLHRFRARRGRANDDPPAGNNISELSVGPNRSHMKEWTSIQTSNSCALACSVVWVLIQGFMHR